MCPNVANPAIMDIHGARPASQSARQADAQRKHERRIEQLRADIAGWRQRIHGAEQELAGLHAALGRPHTGPPHAVHVQAEGTVRR